LNGNWSLDSTSGPTGFTYTLSNSSTTLSLIAAANSNNFYWTGSASANWSGDNFSATDGGASTLSGGNLSAASDLIFTATGATNLATTMDSNYTVNSLSITTPGVSIGGSNTLTVNSTASTAIGISAASGNTTISANLAGASAGLTKSGAGTLILTGNNTYTGATTITAGTLQIGANGTSGALSITSTLTNNGTLVFNRSNAITQGMDFANVIAGSGNIIKNGAGNLTLNGTNTFTGQLTIAEGAVIVSTLNNSGAAGVFGNSTNSVVLGSSGNNGTLSFTGATVTSSKRFTMATGGTGVFDVATGGQLTVGQIDGSGALSKTGAGNLVLGSANTYSGGSTLGGSGVVVVTIDSVGTVGAPTSGAFGTGTVNLAGAQLRAGTGGSRTVANAITISADTTFVTTGSEKSLTFTGPVTLSGATRTLNVAIGSTVSTEKLTFSGAIGDGGSGFGITKTGAGTLSLSAANTYTGITTVSAGTLEIGHVNALQNTTLDTGTSGAQTVNFTVTGANTYNIGGLQGADALSIGNNTISIGANNANTTYSGGISGTGNLVKNGSGTQTLAGATTFNGTTTVNSGTLKADAANALANTSQVVLNNGGSFLVTADDAVGTNTGIELNGGTLAFGAAGYDGYVGALTLSANSTIDLGTSSNGVLIRFNSINWNNSNALLSIYNWTGNTYYQGGYDNNLDKVIFTNPNFTTSELQRISFYSGIDQSSFVGDATLITSGLFPNQIIAVPETETYITGVILLLGFTIYQLRLARHGQGLLSRLTFLRQRKC
jgi:autotransporter-associated beta strand protein